MSGLDLNVIGKKQRTEYLNILEKMLNIFFYIRISINIPSMRLFFQG